jgi:hypothetical protein
MSNVFPMPNSENIPLKVLISFFWASYAFALLKLGRGGPYSGASRSFPLPQEHDSEMTMLSVAKAPLACASTRVIGFAAMRVMTTNCNPIKATADETTIT